MFPCANLNKFSIYLPLVLFLFFCKIINIMLNSIFQTIPQQPKTQTKIQNMFMAITAHASASANAL